MKDKNKGFFGRDADFSPYGPRPDLVHPFDSNFNWKDDDKDDDESSIDNILKR